MARFEVWLGVYLCVWLAAHSCHTGVDALVRPVHNAAERVGGAPTASRTQQQRAAPVFGEVVWTAHEEEPAGVLKEETPLREEVVPQLVSLLETYEGASMRVLHSVAAAGPGPCTGLDTCCGLLTCPFNGGVCCGGDVCCPANSFCIPDPLDSKKKACATFGQLPSQGLPSWGALLDPQSSHACVNQCGAPVQRTCVLGPYAPGKVCADEAAVPANNVACCTQSISRGDRKRNAPPVSVLMPAPNVVMLHLPTLPPPPRPAVTHEVIDIHVVPPTPAVAPRAENITRTIVRDTDRVYVVPSPQINTKETRVERPVHIVLPPPPPRPAPPPVQHIVIPFHQNVTFGVKPEAPTTIHYIEAMKVDLKFTIAAPNIFKFGQELLSDLATITQEDRTRFTLYTASSSTAENSTSISCFILKRLNSAPPLDVYRALADYINSPTTGKGPLVIDRYLSLTAGAPATPVTTVFCPTSGKYMIKGECPDEPPVTTTTMPPLNPSNKALLVQMVFDTNLTIAANNSQFEFGDMLVEDLLNITKEEPRRFQIYNVSGTTTAVTARFFIIDTLGNGDHFSAMMKIRQYVDNPVNKSAPQLIDKFLNKALSLPGLTSTLNVTATYCKPLERFTTETECTALTAPPPAAAAAGKQPNTPPPTTTVPPLAVKEEGVAEDRKVAVCEYWGGGHLTSFSRERTEIYGLGESLLYRSAKQDEEARVILRNLGSSTPHIAGLVIQNGQNVLSFLRNGDWTVDGLRRSDTGDIRDEDVPLAINFNCLPISFSKLPLSLSNTPITFGPFRVWRMRAQGEFIVLVLNVRKAILYQFAITRTDAHFELSMSAPATAVDDAAGMCGRLSQCVSREGSSSGCFPGASSWLITPELNQPTLFDCPRDPPVITRRGVPPKVNYAAFPWQHPILQAMEAPQRQTIQRKCQENVGSLWLAQCMLEVAALGDVNDLDNVALRVAVVKSMSMRGQSLVAFAMAHPVTPPPKKIT